MEINTDPQKIEEALTRGVENVYPSKKALEEALKSGRKLTIYHGVDPTAPHLHLGHSTNYLLLRRFQELGHRIIVLIGDFTARIGDPTGELSTRRSLSISQVLNNCKNYQKQIAKILDFKSPKNPVTIKYNSEWLDKLDFHDIIQIAAKFTVGQIIKRKIFQERIKKKKEIYIHEFLYPLIQGYDSVALDTDVEVGGRDQTFNMLIGRDFIRIYKRKEKFVISTQLLINPKTGEKLMSKSKGDFIALDALPKEMYGKIMALPDEVIVPCFQLCTEAPLADIQKIEQNLKQKRVNPRDLKTKLAKEIVAVYHGKKSALLAEKEFEKVFKDKGLPSQIPVIKIQEKSLNILDLLAKTKLASSKSEAKRLILQGGVKIDGQVQTDWQKIIEIKKGHVLQVGKRKFAKIA